MIVGTAGHIDHGKTSLVKRLTGTDTDRLPEEKERGISIDLGFAYWPRADGRVIGFVDMPGHEGLVHNMLAGATGIDFVLLVVAADDGVMPQTREHLAIVDLLGLGAGVVAVTKCDRVDTDRRATVCHEIRATLSGTTLEHAPIVPVSAVTGAGIDVLTRLLDGATARLAARATNGRFRLGVDRCFTRAGLGTVVTGTVLSGRVGVNASVLVSPAGLDARVRSIHTYGQPAEHADAGQRCALLLSGGAITKDSVGRGDVVLDPELHAPTSRIDVRLKVLMHEPAPIGQWFPVKVHHAASSVPGRVVVLGEGGIAPGSSDFAQLVLERPLAAAVCDRFVVRDTSSRRTIGGGVILDLRPPERKRRTPQRRAELSALTGLDPLSTLQQLLQQPQAFIDLDRFFRDRAGTAESATTAAAQLRLECFTVGAACFALSLQNWLTFRQEIVAVLDSFHMREPDRRGVGLEQLRRSMASRMPVPLFGAMLRRCASLGDVVLDRGTARRPQHQAAVGADDEVLWREVEPLLGATPFRPPRVRDLARSLDSDEDVIRGVLRRIERRGDVEEIGHDRFFSRGAVSAMVRILRELAAASAEGLMATAGFRDRLDCGRRVAVEILEHFDHQGLTMLRGSGRRINPHWVFDPLPDPVPVAGLDISRQDNSGRNRDL